METSRGSSTLINNAVCGPPSQELHPKPNRLTSVIKTGFSILEENGASGLNSPANKITRATTWVISLSLVLYAVFAPHSIAITQGSYLLGLVAWGLQLISTRKLRQARTPVDIALFGFFACCVISSFLSYDPLVSLKGLRSPAFFLAFYFVSSNVRSARFASLLALTLVVSCLVNVGYSGAKLAAGRGLQIDSINAGSAFATDTIRVGDVILQADDQPVNTLDELSRIVDSRRGRLRLKLRRTESEIETSVPRSVIRDAKGDGVERLGITTSPGRNFRITGFYSHYETYAEVLQLIASLAIALLIAAPKRRSPVAWFLYAAIGLLVATLILTSTRAALMGLAISVATMAVASSRRRVLIAAAAGVLVVLPLALLAVEHSRGISVFDPEEGSTAYRLEVWREAFGIIQDNPLVGIGKGSEGKLKTSLGLYDEGRLPPGHFHSTPVQIAVWWGLLGLTFYYAFMTILLLEIWRAIKLARSWQTRGITLGVLGAVVAFNVSALAHFNFGDGEVVMAFWLLTGLAFAVRRIAREKNSPGTEELQASPSSADSRRNQLPRPAAIAEPSVRAAKAKQN
jgi:hypothetical protein